MKATMLIRREGLKQRMPQEPLRFLSDINKLAMAMSASGRRPDAKKQRKRVLRQMRALQRKITRHAQAHRDLLSCQLTPPRSRRSDCTDPLRLPAISY